MCISESVAARSSTLESPPVMSGEICMAGLSHDDDGDDLDTSILLQEIPTQPEFPHWSERTKQLPRRYREFAVQRY